MLKINYSNLVRLKAHLNSVRELNKQISNKLINSNV